jgi:hypothetical protein
MNTPNNVNKFKVNLDLMQAQSRDFTRGGVLLKNIYGISAKHPALSVIFILSFGLLISSMYDLVTYVTVDVADFGVQAFILHVLLVLLFTLIAAWTIVRLRALHKDLFVDTPLAQKKVLFTLASSRQTDFKATPSYNTYESLLYNVGQAAPNALERVVLIASEAPESQTTAATLKAYIESSGRQAEVFGISIADKSLMEIQSQIATLFKRIEGSYAPHEIIADYTGGTKDMSIALLKESEKELVVPIYLNDATLTNHSRHN